MHPARIDSTPALFNQILDGHTTRKRLGTPPDLFDVREYLLDLGQVLRSLWAGTISAATLPRRVIRIRSPRDARSTNSDSFCLASNMPTVRMNRLSSNNLDE